MTLRERAWHVTLITKISQAETFKRKQLGFEESERHTVQRALNSMEEWGWLYRETETGGIWEPGVLTRWIFTDEQLTPEEEAQLEEHLKPVAEQTDTDLGELKEQLRSTFTE